MQAKVYNLPEISFVGGETHDLLFHLFTETGRVFSASGATATFSIVEAQSPVFPRLKRSRCRSSQEVNDSPTPFSALNYC